LRRRFAGDESRRACDEALERVGLSALAERYPSQLSGGEQQRVALARALVARPRLLLFDEPLSHLDADLRERLRVEISTIARESGATCVYITHDQREAFALADRIGVLNKGELLQIGRPEDVHARPVSPFVAAFSGIAGTLSVELTSPPGSDGRTSFRVAGSLVELAGTWCGSQPSPTGRATAMIRPSAVGIVDPLAGGLPAVVVDTAFRGDGYDHVLNLASGALFLGVPEARRWERGSNVGVAVDPKGCLLYEDEGGGDLPASAIPESVLAVR
jgi:iron(III) transport system ATP-binding protein